MNTSTIPPCRSQQRWACTNMQGSDYCNRITGKPMPPTFSRTAVTSPYTATTTPTSWSPTLFLQHHQQYNTGLSNTYLPPAAWKRPLQLPHSFLHFVFSAMSLFLFTLLFPKLKQPLPFVRYIKNGQKN